MIFSNRTVRNILELFQIRLSRICYELYQTGLSRIYYVVKKTRHLTDRKTSLTFDIRKIASFKVYAFLLLQSNKLEGPVLMLEPQKGSISSATVSLESVQLSDKKPLFQ